MDELQNHFTEEAPENPVPLSPKSNGVPNTRRTAKAAALLLLIIPYLLYVGFVIRLDRGPVDYETFMSIGHRLVSGQKVYGENSYYPMPYVMVFAVFSVLPRPVSMAVWLLSPVATALAISGWSPWVLAFAPLFGHFVGGQSAVFSMLGFWGYRRHATSQKARAGLWLGLILIKPQLGVVPLAYAIGQWVRGYRQTKQVPRQFWAFLAATLILYLPGFALIPDWPLQWLGHPRPLFARALAGIVPRTLLLLMPTPTVLYWLLLALIGLVLLAIVWLFEQRQITLDVLMLWGFVVSPLVQDYDLIQLVPLLESDWLKIAAVLLSIPLWVVIVFAYGNDAAWFAVTLIAPGLLFLILVSKAKKLKRTRQVTPPETKDLLISPGQG